ncbi:hypothetical protein L1887_62087 [Cichorium endivia]|nr:hypothetical protein L1887_62087 [Cichorium endivia]
MRLAETQPSGYSATACLAWHRKPLHLAALTGLAAESQSVEPSKVTSQCASTIGSWPTMVEGGGGSDRLAELTSVVVGTNPKPSAELPRRVVRAQPTRDHNILAASVCPAAASYGSAYSACVVCSAPPVMPQETRPLRRLTLGRSERSQAWVQIGASLGAPSALANALSRGDLLGSCFSLAAVKLNLFFHLRLPLAAVAEPSSTVMTTALGLQERAWLLAWDARATRATWLDAAAPRRADANLRITSRRTPASSRPAGLRTRRFACAGETRQALAVSGGVLESALHWQPRLKRGATKLCALAIPLNPEQQPCRDASEVSRWRRVARTAERLAIGSDVHLHARSGPVRFLLNKALPAHTHSVWRTRLQDRKGKELVLVHRKTVRGTDVDQESATHLSKTSARTESG